MGAFEARGVLCAPVNGYPDIEGDPQIRASEIIVEEQHPRAGRFRTLDTAVRFAKTPGARRRGAPALGEHTDEVLREAGLTADQLTRLHAASVIR